MKTRSIWVGAFLVHAMALLGCTVAFADADVSYSIEFGALNPVSYSEGSGATISGEIHSDLNGKSLYSRIQKGDFKIISSFPDANFDISPRVSVTQIGNQAVRFSFHSDQLKAIDLNQFRIDLIQESKDERLMRDIQRDECRLTRVRLNLEDYLRKRHPSNKVIAQYNRKIANLNSLINKIETKINNMVFLLAEGKKGLLVVGSPTADSLTSSLNGKTRIELSANPGTGIASQSEAFRATIVHLSNKDKNEVQALQILLGNQVLVESTTETASYNTNSLQPGSYVFVAQLLIYKNEKDFQKKKDANKIASTSLRLDVSAQLDSDPPVLSVAPGTSLPTGALNQIQPLQLQIADTGVGVDANSFQAHLSGVLNDGTPVNRDITSSFIISGADPHLLFVMGNLLPLFDGNYTLAISISDKANNHANLNANFSLDTLPPVFALSEVVPPNTSQSTYALNLSSADLSPETITVTQNGNILGTFQVNSVSPNVSLTLNLVEGNNIISTTAVDAVGNSTNQTYTILLDTQGPVVAQSAAQTLPAATNQETVSVTLNVQDLSPTSTNISLNNILVDEADNNKIITQSLDLNDGDNTIGIASIDSFGHLSNSSVHILFDDEPPVIAIAPLAAPTNAENQKLIFTVSDNTALTSTTTVKLNGSLLTLADPHANSFDLTLPLTNGNNLIEVSSIDAAGNNSMTQVTRALGAAGPLSLTNLQPLDGQTLNKKTLTVSGVASNPLYSVSVNGVSLQIDSTGKIFSGQIFLENGIQSLAWAAQDISGQQTTVSTQVTISVSDILWTYEECPVSGNGL